MIHHRAVGNDFSLCSFICYEKKKKKKYQVIAQIINFTNNNKLEDSLHGFIYNECSKLLSYTQLHDTNYRLISEYIFKVYKIATNTGNCTNRTRHKKIEIKLTVRVKNIKRCNEIS